MSESKKKPRSAIVVDGRTIIDVDKLTAHHIQSIASKKTRNLSRLLRSKHGIGVVEWRLITGLAREPGIAASDLSKYTITDKAQVSKALKCLSEKGLIAFDPKTESSHRKKVYLTEKGFELHDAFLPTLLKRESAIFADSAEAEVDQFFVMLKRVSANLDKFMEEEN